MRDLRSVLTAAALVFVVIVIALLSWGRPGRTSPRQVLDTQLQAWNSGDLDRFMTTYWRSEELNFLSGDTRLEGWEPLMERYRSRYQSGSSEMGRLDFSEVQIRRLGEEHALAHGRWELERTGESDLGGRFTLVLHRFDREGWKIIHDHTSAAAAGNQNPDSEG